MASITQPGAAMHPCWEERPHHCSVNTREEKHSGKGPAQALSVPIFRHSQGWQPQATAVPHASRL